MGHFPAPGRQPIMSMRWLRMPSDASDHLEFSGQLGGTPGYQKSVRNLIWSYAAFPSAVRGRVNS